MNSNSSELSSEAETFACEEERARALADLDLVRRSLLGNTQTAHTLMDRLGCVARMVASKNARMGRPLDASEVEDVVQNTLILIWKKRAEFLGTGPLEAWVYRISYLEFMNRMRKRLRSPKSLEEAGVAEHNEPAAAAEPDALEFEVLHQSLDIVGPPDANVVRLKHFDSLTFDQIAVRLDIPANTAKTQYYRGLEKLRRQLGDSYFG